MGVAHKGIHPDILGAGYHGVARSEPDYQYISGFRIGNRKEAPGELAHASTCLPSQYLEGALQALQSSEASPHDLHSILLSIPCYTDVAE